MPVNAFIFPGQGSQFVGMGRDLAAAFAAAREVFDEVDETLKQRLSKLMFEGPAETLTLTENAQPALMAVSMAVVRVLARDGGVRVADRAVLVAGHSLGEYSALAAAEALDVATVARLLRLRGEAMQAAVAPGEGAMAALLGVEMAVCAEICAEAAVLKRPGEPDVRQVVAAANDNGGGQVVISGHKAAVERAVEIAKLRGVKRAMLLPVSAPFHCALMAPAADAMAQALEEVTLRRPVVPVIANVTAAKVTAPDDIKRHLVAQVTGTVRWRESMMAALDMGVDSFIELGAGKVLTGLVKRIAPDARGLNAGTPADIEALLKVL
jgi:[acyl-carrier-protein] S-malonyltransferase